jgi:hypothetical protein
LPFSRKSAAAIAVRAATSPGLKAIAVHTLSLVFDVSGFWPLLTNSQNLIAGYICSLYLKKNRDGLGRVAVILAGFSH